MFSRRGADPALRVGGAIFASRRTRRANQCQRGAGRVGGGHGYELSRTGAARGPRWGVAGVAVRCVRPPYGAIDDGVATRLTERGLTPMLWNVDPADWTKPGTAAVAGRVIAGLRPGAVVLMHDGGGDRSQTVGALNTILDAIEQRGYA